jgi:predicted  nucleic acid-binding Zn ribbon protein
LWLNSGEYEDWAKDRLLDRDGQVNRHGFEIVERLSHIAKTYYLWFRDSLDDEQPSQCPLCGAPLESIEGCIFLLCEHCRILT